MKSKFLAFALLALNFCTAQPALAMMPYSSNSQLAPTNSDTINNYALVGNTAKTVTWPAGALTVNVVCPYTYWTSLQSGITIPVADNTAGSGAAINTAQRHKGLETAFYIISTSSQVCSAEFWSN